MGYISPIYGADSFGPISTKIGMAVRIDDVITHSNFGLNMFSSFIFTGGQNFRFPIDFAGHVTTVLPLPRSM